MDYQQYVPQPLEVSEDNLRRSLAEVYLNIEQLLSVIPDDCDESELNDDQIDAVVNIDAIEQEWILNPDVRNELSVIQWRDDED